MAEKLAVPRRHERQNFVGTQHGDCGFRIRNFLVTKVEEILAHFTARKKNAKL